MDRKYTVVKPSELPNLLERLKESKRVAIDTETTGLEIFKPEFRLVGLALASSPSEGYYIPIGHENFGGLDYQPENVSLEAVKDFLSELLQHVRPIYHNASYDRLVLAKTLGIPFEQSYGDDTMIALHLMDENHPSSLKEWAKTVLGIKEQVTKFVEPQLSLFTEDFEYALNKAGRRYRKRVYRLREDWLDQVYAYFKEYIHRGAVSYSLLYKLISSVFGALRARGLVEYAGTFPNDFRYFPVSIAAEYALDDVMNTYALWEHVQVFLDMHPKLDKLYQEIELPVNDVMTRATYHGVWVNQEHLRQVKELLLGRLEETKNRAYGYLAELLPPEKLMGVYNLDTVLNSAIQLRKILYEDLGFPVVEVTNSGEASTSRTALQAILQRKLLPRRAPALKNTAYAFIQAKLEYEAIKKLLSTYTDSLIEKLDPDSRIHTFYNTVGTVSGRMSSSDPNLQNLPRLLPEEVAEKPYLQGVDIRKAFEADPGYVFVTADYTSMELVMCAAVSGDETMRDLLNQGRDLHAYTARYAFRVGLDLDDKEFKAKYKDYRQKAKIVNFALIYGGTQYTLVRNFGFTEDEALQLIEGYFKAYPRVKVWMEEVYKELEEKGYVEYPIYGYIKRLDLPEKLRRAMKELWPHIIANDREVSRQYHAALRTCQNALIQGLSAFVVKEAIVEIDRRLKEEGLDAWVAYQVHDEIGVQANVKHAKRVMEIMLECMVREVNGVKLDAEPELKRTMSKAEAPIKEEELHGTATV